jgi:hypothetical protein
MLSFWIGVFLRYEVGGDNQEMELQVAQAKIDVAEYMKTAPDLMDENSNLTHGSCWFSCWKKQFTRLIVLHVIEQMVADKLVQT